MSETNIIARFEKYKKYHTFTKLFIPVRYVFSVVSNTGKGTYINYFLPVFFRFFFLFFCLEIFVPRINPYHWYALGAVFIFSLLFHLYYW